VVGTHWSGDATSYVVAWVVFYRKRCVKRHAWPFRGPHVFDELLLMKAGIADVQRDWGSGHTLGEDGNRHRVARLLPREQQIPHARAVHDTGRQLIPDCQDVLSVNV
jgi:hypothetical protein